METAFCSKQNAVSILSIRRFTKIKRRLEKTKQRFIKMLKRNYFMQLS